MKGYNLFNRMEFLPSERGHNHTCEPDHGIHHRLNQPRQIQLALRLTFEYSEVRSTKKGWLPASPQVGLVGISGLRRRESGRGDERIPVTAKATPRIFLRCFTALVIAACAMPAAGEDTASGYAGSEVCGKCHAAQFESQSKTAHAHALRRAQATDPGPGSHSQWAFGAGTAYGSSDKEAGK